ncbi:hypothetical protein D1007_24422 [Hordeum vulgare]|nr:hypothetical protein D1007_24422 [Hordeum vulgare]
MAEISLLPAKVRVSAGRHPVAMAVRTVDRSYKQADVHKQAKVKQIVGSTLRDASDDGTALVTNFESDKSPAEFANIYKEDGLVGGHVIMLGGDPASRSTALEALHAYPDSIWV